MNESYSWVGKKVVILGGSGFLGGLCRRYFRGNGAQVVVISRRCPEALDTGIDGTRDWVDWNDGPETWSRVLDGADAVINLVGRSVNCRKTPAHCDEILRSRVESVRHLAQALQPLGKCPPVWIQAGTAHIYGDPPDVRVDDNAAIGWGFAPFVGQAWERAFFEHLPPIMRGVILRTSFVLDRDAGPLPVLVRLAKCGLGGRAGHGRQGFSWIHASDFVAIVARAIRDTSLSGTLNVTAPEPVSQAEFMRTLRAVLKIPLGLPAPSLAVRMGARWLLNTDPELVLEGRYVVPSKLLAAGYVFQHAQLRTALAKELARNI